MTLEMFALILLTNFVAAIIVTMDATVTTKAALSTKWRRAGPVGVQH